MLRTRSLRHAKRYRHVTFTLTKYGLRDLLAYIRIVRLPRWAKTPQIIKETAQNLRLAIQELGPTFIKGGQVLSSRSDLLPDIVIEELQKLLDEVKPLDFDVIKARIEKELGGKINDLFEYVEKEPIASASLAQVHKAKLKNGQIAALKILRPGIGKIISTDIDILYDIASTIQDRTPILRAYNLFDLVSELENNLKKELDLRLEGLNSEIIARNTANIKNFKIPKVFWQYSTKKILCLEYVEGFKITQINKLKKAGLDLHEIATRILEVFTKQVYIDGFFQADPHIGNLFINENGLIQIIDFGSIGKLDEGLKKDLAELVFFLLDKEGELATEILLRIGKQKPHTNYSLLRNDVSALIADYSTLPTEYLSMGKAIFDLTKIAVKHHIELPSIIAQLGRTYLLLDDIIKRLDPNFNLSSYNARTAPIILREHLKSNLSPLRITRNSIETSNLVTKLPSKINYFVDKILKDEFHVVFQHEGLEKVIEGLSTAGFSISLAFITTGLSLISILIFIAGMPIIAYIIGALDSMLMLYLLFKLLRNIKWK